MVTVNTRRGKFKLDGKGTTLYILKRLTLFGRWLKYLQTQRRHIMVCDLNKQQLLTRTSRDKIVVDIDNVSKKEFLGLFKAGAEFGESSVKFVKLKLPSTSDDIESYKNRILTRVDLIMNMKNIDTMIIGDILKIRRDISSIIASRRGFGKYSGSRDTNGDVNKAASAWRYINKTTFYIITNIISAFGRKHDDMNGLCMYTINMKDDKQKYIFDDVVNITHQSLRNRGY